MRISKKKKKKKPGLQYYISLSMVCLLILMNITYLLRLQWRKNYLLLTFTEVFFVTRSASFRFWKLNFSIHYFHKNLAKNEESSKFFKNLKPKLLESNTVRYYSSQQLIAILFWITYPRVRYPKKNDMTCPLLFPSRL